MLLYYPPLQIAKSFLLAFIHDSAILILYFITSPSWPVTSILPFEFGYFIAYTKRSFPPIYVQAIPFTTPTPVHLYYFLIGPSIFVITSAVIFVCSFFLAIFRHIFAKFLYNCLTPISWVYLTNSSSAEF